MGSPIPAGPESQERIGAYRILETLGEGGMGTVYLAEQEQPLRRRVALKVIKLGMDSRQVVARFEAERQALARMDHPNIARVFDAGSAPDGRPYFVMEYVAGIPITDYCDRYRLSMRERLKLFGELCAAVQHAHTKGIIHRDLKPSNVLVTVDGGQPVPKVIDFGVAKATNQRLTERTLFTQHGALVGTPEYMSPEQAEMTGLDVDTRSDIYSLGVVLYELLTGTLPFDRARLREAGFLEIQRIIREEEATRPSTRLTGVGSTAAEAARRRRTTVAHLARELRGDLDWITLKALDKDRTRRYAAASDLAADLARYLDNEPVAARPPSAIYRTRKFARRHRFPVFVAIGLVLGLTGGLAYGVFLERSKVVVARGAEEIEDSRRLFQRLAPGVSLELSAAIGAGPSVEGVMEGARRRFEEFKFDQAVLMLDRVIETLTLLPSGRSRINQILLRLIGGKPRTANSDLLVEAYELRGRAWFALGSFRAAERNFVALLAIEPTHELDPYISPKVRAAFEQVRQGRD